MAQHASTDIQLKTMVLPMADGSNQKYYIGYDSDDIVNLSNVQGENVTEALNNLSGDIARAFDPNQDYYTGQLVSYQGILYQFINDHPAGAWDSSDVEQTTLGEELEPLISQCYANIILNTADGEILPWQSTTITITVLDSNDTQIYQQTYQGQPLTVPVKYNETYRFQSSVVTGYWNLPAVNITVRHIFETVTLTYETIDSIDTFPKAKAALDVGADFSTAVGNQLISTKENQPLVWDIVDYDSAHNEITLMTHDLIYYGIQYDPQQAIAYFENGLSAGSYYVTKSSTVQDKNYFTLQNSIPVNGVLLFSVNSSQEITSFSVYASNTSFVPLETGNVSTTVINGATALGIFGVGDLNSIERCYGGGNIHDSAALVYLNSSAHDVNGLTIVGTLAVSRPITVTSGFLYGWDQDDLDCVANTTWKCASCHQYEAPSSIGGIFVKDQTYTITSKICLPSEMEITGDNTNNVLPDGSTQFDLFVGSTSSDLIKYRLYISPQTHETVYEARGWRTRTSRYAGSTISITDKGEKVSGYHATTDFIGLAPICKIKGEPIL